MLQLRPATTDDARFVWECRNDPQALAMSGSTGDIPYPTHCDWFKQQAPTYQIGHTSDGIAVGYVRIADSTISVAVHPACRRMGFGLQILQQASTPGLTAWIRPENFASQATFAAAGYVQDGTVTSSGVTLQRWLR